METIIKEKTTELRCNFCAQSIGQGVRGVRGIKGVVCQDCVIRLKNILVEDSNYERSIAHE